MWFYYFLGLGKLSEADEYLAQAEWTVLKSYDVTDEHKSKLYRNMGLLYAAKGDYENSLRTLAEDVRMIFAKIKLNHNLKKKIFK